MEKGKNLILWPRGYNPMEAVAVVFSIGWCLTHHWSHAHCTSVIAFHFAFHNFLCSGHLAKQGKKKKEQSRLSVSLEIRF
ncbi:hypothetical protein XELAEV_18034569mg [Xenopus laevis]|uniref:Uncharacterized protein n=1 Tax=Xenopus laevis TaxID=8355 RepID=A0A974CGC3_XENLA|nr:hypothetical protein XELAEV_18034569mg [Xenopus laevis]